MGLIVIVSEYHDANMYYNNFDVVISESGYGHNERSKAYQFTIVDLYIFVHCTILILHHMQMYNNNNSKWWHILLWNNTIWKTAIQF